jgi:hypothetical protein
MALVKITQNFRTRVYNVCVMSAICITSGFSLSSSREFNNAVNFVNKSDSVMTLILNMQNFKTSD